MANPFCHVELSTDNTKKAKEFYSKVFSWQFDEMPSPTGGVYTTIKAGEGPGGGLFQKPDPQIPNMWLPYVEVDSVDKSVVQVREFGGKIIKEKTTIPAMGAFAIISDPNGAALGIWETAKK